MARQWQWWINGKNTSADKKKWLNEQEICAGKRPARKACCTVAIAVFVWGKEGTMQEGTMPKHAAVKTPNDRPHFNPPTYQWPAAVSKRILAV